MMVATWVGGPWDGRTDVLPDGTESVSVAHASKFVVDYDGTEYGNYFRQNRCPVMAQRFGTDWEFVIVWHE